VPFAPGQNTRTPRNGILNMFFRLFNGGIVNQGPLQHPGLKPVANFEVFDSLD